MQPPRPNDGENVVSVFIVFCAGINPRLVFQTPKIYQNQGVNSTFILVKLPFVYAGFDGVF
jgi:hypothetical protein